jgi:hypothetical protein
VSSRFGECTLAPPLPSPRSGEGTKDACALPVEGAYPSRNLDIDGGLRRPSPRSGEGTHVGCDENSRGGARVNRLQATGLRHDGSTLERLLARDTRVRRLSVEIDLRADRAEARVAFVLDDLSAFRAAATRGLQ